MCSKTIVLVVLEMADVRCFAAASERHRLDHPSIIHRRTRYFIVRSLCFLTLTPRYRSVLS